MNQGRSRARRHSLGMWAKIVISLVINFGVALSAYAEIDKRTALVIGNSQYLQAPLENTQNDAADIAAALEALDFDVMYQENADRPTMRRLTRKFRKAINKGGVGLFYYAGHGIQASGQNYLIPIGASFKHEYELPDEAISADAILRTMEDAGNRLNIVILDASRNNPFTRQFRSVASGLARMDAPAGSIVAHSTTPGSLAVEGDGRNSLYTQNLLAAMSTPNLTIEEVFKRVRVKVAQQSDGKQVPWEESSLVGNFYFTIVNTPEPVTVQQTVAGDSAARQEVLVWQGIAKSDNPADFEQFLQDFPNGIFADYARNRMDEMSSRSTLAIAEVNDAGNNVDRTSDNSANDTDVGETASQAITTTEPNSESTLAVNSGEREETLTVASIGSSADIEYLLAQAERAYDALHLTTPAGDNAYDYYNRVLALDPTNSRANFGIQRIVNRYVDLALQSSNRGQYGKANKYLDRGSAIDPDSLAIKAAKVRLSNKPSYDVQPTYPTISTAKAGYRRGELTKVQYSNLVRGLKIKIRDAIVELKRQYRAGQISKREYKRKANLVKARYE